nr:nef protein [Human immunodeficiency virus 1]
MGGKWSKRSVPG